jgi:hypothetical protein
MVSTFINSLLSVMKHSFVLLVLIFLNRFEILSKSFSYMIVFETLFHFLLFLKQKYSTYRSFCSKSKDQQDKTTSNPDGQATILVSRVSFGKKTRKTNPMDIGLSVIYFVSRVFRA